MKDIPWKLHDYQFYSTIEENMRSASSAQLIKYRKNNNEIKIKNPKKQKLKIGEKREREPKNVYKLTRKLEL